MSRYREVAPAWLTTVVLGVACSGLALLIWSVMGLTHDRHFSVGLMMGHWFVAAAILTTWSQRLIGGGRLDNRVIFRLILGNAVYFFAIAPTGLFFLLPACTALVAAKHLQWSGSRTWRPAAAMTVIYTGIVQFAPHHGTDFSLPMRLSNLATVATLAVGLGMIATVASLTYQREEDARLLMAEQSRRESELHDAAIHDALTSLLNRGGLTATLERARQRVVVGKGIGILYMDLDGFKAVNDTRGHAVGDDLLREVALRLSAVVRPGDCVARMGGDEFVAVLEGLADAAPLDGVTDRIAEALSTPFTLSGVMVNVAVSVGSAFSDDPDLSIEDLLVEADSAMFTHKRARKGPVEAGTATRATTAPGLAQAAVSTLGA